ncbi:hypothetical protein B0E54_03125 [Micromonospora sp. MH99]|nr:hypothetical protein [Micromonospora sp. MH99]
MTCRETLCHVCAYAVIWSGSPASQSRASESGLTCSMSQATPHETIDPIGSTQVASTSIDVPKPPIVVSIQDPLSMP